MADPKDADKADSTHIDELPPDVPPTSGAVMRTTADDLSIWEAVKQYRLVTAVAMAAAFSASLDGYQITLNGGIVANKGFVRQFGNASSGIISGTYVSAWGGIQSAGQCIGQIGLQFATDALGRKAALWILWVFLTASIFAETFATNWQHWLVAKLFSGMGVGMLQATVPVYLAELAPTQLKGMLISAYTFWFVIGQLCGAVALDQINAAMPLNFRLAIYTQWAMIGTMGVIFLLLPETPWWLVGRSRTDKAAKVLLRYNGHVQGYNVHQAIDAMAATIEHEQLLSQTHGQEGILSVFKGRNWIRFVISSWPKITQQFVGLTVFNTFSTYFFQAAGSKNPFQVTVILTCCQLLSMIITALTTDKLGRRPLTIYPYAVTVLSVLALGIVGCFNYTSRALGSLPVFFACLATLTTTGASAIGYAYAAEVPQQRLRARTAGWALAFSNLVAIMFNFTTPIMIHGSANWGVKTAFFFAGTGAVSVVISWFIMPEIARRTPGEIDEMFEKRINLRKFKHYVTDVQTNAEVHFRKEEQA